MRFLRHIYIVVIGLALTLAACSVRSQLPQMTPSQARQLLLPYILAPDSTLSISPITDTNSKGHPEFLFYGDKGGCYNIDAVTAEKRLRFAGISGGSHTPTNPPFSPDQLQQTAISYVSQHCPNFTTSMIHTNPDPIDVQEDADEYYVVFFCPSSVRCAHTSTLSRGYGRRQRKDKIL